MPRGQYVRNANRVEAAEQQVGQDNPRLMRSTGPAKDALDPAYIEVVDRPVDEEWAAMMAFAKEKVVVTVATTNDKNAERVVEIWNSGDLCRFPRGEAVTCERRFVETLARAKQTTYTQRKVKDEQSGIEQYLEIPTTGLRYPFSLDQDNNPKGRDWLKAILAEA